MFFKKLHIYIDFHVVSERNNVAQHVLNTVWSLSLIIQWIFKCKKYNYKKLGQQQCFLEFWTSLLDLIRAEHKQITAVWI